MKTQISKIISIAVIIHGSIGGDVCGKTVTEELSDLINKAKNSRSPFKLKVAKSKRLTIYKWFNPENKRQWRLIYDKRDYTIYFSVNDPITKYTSNTELADFDRETQYDSNKEFKKARLLFDKQWLKMPFDGMRQHYKL